jgi:hypothetical protein
VHVWAIWVQQAWEEGLPKSINMDCAPAFSKLEKLYVTSPDTSVHKIFRIPVCTLIRYKLTRDLSTDGQMLLNLPWDKIACDLSTDRRIWFNLSWVPATIQHLRLQLPWLRSWFPWLWWWDGGDLLDAWNLLPLDLTPLCGEFEIWYPIQLPH